MFEDLIVIDIQPEYEDYWSFNMVKFIDYMKTKKDILYIFNGPELSMSSEEDMKNWLFEYGLVEKEEEEEGEDYSRLDYAYEEAFNNITFKDKSYGFFRSWMDYGISDEDVLKVLTYMENEDKYDSRDIDHAILCKLLDQEDLPEDDVLFIPRDLDKNVLMQYNNCELVGGGKNECLKEFEILLQLYNISYKINKKFTY